LAAGGFFGEQRLFGSLLARFQRCLGNRLTAPAGPRPYGGTTTALLESVTTLPTAGGETRIELRLIDAPETSIPAYHYVTLGIAREAREAEDGD